MRSAIVALVLVGYDCGSLVKMEHGMIGVTQWNADTGNNDDHLDLQARSSRAFTAPGC